jgi:penicillin G amidase
MVNVAILDMMHAKDLGEALNIARRWRGPSQNVLLADRGGRIAWVVSGYLPRRRGFDGKTPMSWADGAIGWDGELPEDQRPSLVDPPSGVLYTANNRTVDATWARRIGHLWDISFRAARIKELLEAGDKFTERDLQAIQLDTRNRAYDFYRDLILEVTANAPADQSGMARARDLATAWNGTADADQVGYRLLRLYRGALHEALVPPLIAPAIERMPSLRYFWMNDEEPLRQILEQRPPHLLPEPYESWEQLLRDRLDAALKQMAAESPTSGMDATWGEVNRATIRHPVTRAMPMLGALLNMPADPLSGDRWTVRVATEEFGASMRMVVGPGHEENGLLHMPGGQSGHPLSPHYRDGHAVWVQGLPTPFRAGPTRHTLRLVPGL